MKANKVPKKIYINPMPNPSDGYVGVAWSEPHIDMKEYIRTDAVIEKACEYLSYHLDTNKIDVNYKFEFIEELRKYMKGE